MANETVVYTPDNNGGSVPAWLAMNNGGFGVQPTPNPTANYAPNATDGAAHGAQNGNGKGRVLAFGKASGLA